MKIVTRISSFVFVILLHISLKAQDTATWKMDLAKLNHFHSTMFLGINPNDIDTSLAKKIHNEYFDRVGFLSVTRGESIASENIEKSLNFIQRSIYQTNKALTKVGNWYDNLYFTRAFDIPTTSNADSVEIFKKSWDRTKIIGDLVWCLRTFQPDQIILSDKLIDTATQYLYIRNMIRDACQYAADSTFYSEQFDDGRYPWKTKIVSSTQANFTNSTWSVVNSYNNLYQKQLDSVSNIELSKPDVAHFLFNFRLLIDSLGYSNRIWSDYKKEQVNSLLLKYSDVNIGGEMETPYLILGERYTFSLQYSGDNAHLKLKGIHFGNFDTSFSGRQDSIIIEKNAKLTFREMISQPYWLVLPMETSGMYDIEYMQNLDFPVNLNPFIATFSFIGKSHPIRIDAPLYFLKKHGTTTINQYPIITIPAYLSITPEVLLLHTNPSRNLVNIKVQFESKIKGTSLPIRFVLFQKGKQVKILKQKDTIVNIQVGDKIKWNSDLNLNTLNQKDSAIWAEAYIGKTSKIIINSGFSHISLPNMPDIDYHFQPKITVLNKDTIAFHSSKKLLVLGDSIPSANQSLINYALSILHIPYQKKNQRDYLSLDSLRKNSTIILQGKVSNSLDSLLQQYVAEGGKLILFPTDEGSIPTFINDSVITSNIVFYQHDSLYVEMIDKDNSLSNPNNITPEELTSEQIISTSSWQGKGKNIVYPILFKNNQRDSDEIHPIVVLHYGKGTVVLCGLHFDMSSLEKPAIYKLLANLIE